MVTSPTSHAVRAIPALFAAVSGLLLVQFYVGWLDDVHQLLMLLLVAVLASFIGVVVITAVGSARSMTGAERAWMAVPVFVGLLLRLQPNSLQQGGQDQGLYVLNAINFARTGSNYIVDPVQDWSAAALAAKRSGPQMSSVSWVNGSGPLLEIDFYPLHSLLLAIGDFAAGSTGRHVIALLLFLGSLFAWRFLLVKLGGGERAVRLFTLFYAINPALVFITKFPVSEGSAAVLIPLWIGSYVQVIYAGASRGRTRGGRDLLALFIWTVLLTFTRLSVLTFVPALGLLILLPGMLRVPTAERSAWFLRNIVAGGVVAVGFAAVGFVYRLRQPGLYHPMADYLSEVGGILLSSVPRFSVATLVLSAVLAVIYAGSERLARTAQLIVIVGLLAASMGVAGIQFLRLSRASPLIPWGYDYRDDGLLNIRFHFLYLVVLLLGPLVILIALAGAKSVRSQTSVRYALVLAAGLCLSIFARPYVPYLYYYGRYIFVDLLPVLLAAASLVAAAIWQRTRWTANVMSAVIGAGCCYFALFVFPVALKSEQESTNFYREVTSRAAEENLIVVDGMSQQVVPALTIALGLATVPIEASTDEAAFNRVSSLVYGEFSRLADIRFMTQHAIQPDLIYYDSWLSNTGHFREDGLWYSESPYLLMLPLASETWGTAWGLYGPPGCSDVVAAAKTGRIRGFGFGLSVADNVGSILVDIEAEFVCESTGPSLAAPVFEPALDPYITHVERVPCAGCVSGGLSDLWRVTLKGSGPATETE